VFAVIVILLMFAAVIEMVRRLDNARERPAILQPHNSSDTEA